MTPTRHFCTAFLEPSCRQIRESHRSQLRLSSFTSRPASALTHAASSTASTAMASSALTGGSVPSQAAREPLVMIMIASLLRRDPLLTGCCPQCAPARPVLEAPTVGIFCRVSAREDRLRLQVRITPMRLRPAPLWPHSLTKRSISTSFRPPARQPSADLPPLRRLW